MVNYFINWWLDHFLNIFPNIFLKVGVDNLCKFDCFGLHMLIDECLFAIVEDHVTTIPEDVENWGGRSGPLGQSEQMELIVAEEGVGGVFMHQQLCELEPVDVLIFGFGWGFGYSFVVFAGVEMPMDSLRCCCEWDRWLLWLKTAFAPYLLLLHLLLSAVGPYGLEHVF